MNPRTTTLLTALLMTALAFSGCSDDADVEEEKDVMGAVVAEGEDASAVASKDDFHLRDVSQGGNQLAQEISAAERHLYIFDKQVGLPELEPVSLAFSGEVGAQDCGIEGMQDAGGTKAGVEPLGLFDITSSVPAGMPAEIYTKLVFNPDVGNQADLDLWVSFPGVEDGTSIYDDGGWNSASYTFEKRTDITVGTSEAMLVGVECAFDLLATVQTIPYDIYVDIYFENDAIAPYHIYEFEVPEGMKEFTFASKPAEGSDPVLANFILAAPDGTVEWVEAQLNDTSDRLRVPAKGPGTYQFYAHSMQNGFLGVTADLPLEDEFRTARMADPLIVEHPMSDGSMPEAETKVPLFVDVRWDDSQSVNVDSTITISSELGPVLEIERTAKVGYEGNTAGLTNDRVHTFYSPWNLKAGAYTIESSDTTIDLNGAMCVEVYAA